MESGKLFAKKLRGRKRKDRDNMLQHYREKEGNIKRKRKLVWARGLELLKEMQHSRKAGKPFTKRERRSMFVAARKLARKELSKKRG